MKPLLVPSLLLVFLACSCTSTRGLTEQYIKNTIQQHLPGEYDELSTLPIMKQTNTEAGTYVELTGYLYKGKYGLVVGVDQYYKAHPNFKEDNTSIVRYNYVVLNREEVAALLEACRVLDAIGPQRGGREKYKDYTVAEGVYMSYKRGRSGMTEPSLWVFGRKYPVYDYNLTKGLSKFLEWSQGAQPSKAATP